MTRQELYDLVWSKPITHIAKDYGMSDVGIRKHCKKHQVPTPPVGYWMKLEFGKKVKKTPLPTRLRAADEEIHLVPHDVHRVSTEAQRALDDALSCREKLEGRLRIPDRLPRKPQPVVTDMIEALQEIKLDHYGYLRTGEQYYKKFELSKVIVPRVAKLVQSLSLVALEEGYSLRWKEGQIIWRVEEEDFQVRIYELPDKKPHIPNKQEIQRQQREDEWRLKYPRDDRKPRKVYRTWDRPPSGRLALHIGDTNGYWRHSDIENRWVERKSGPSLESRLPDVSIWVAGAAVSARERRLENEAEERRRQEEADRQERARERRARADKLEGYMHELIKVHDKRVKTQALLGYLRSLDSFGVDRRLVAEVEAYESHLARSLTANLKDQSDELHSLLKGDEDLLIPALDLPAPPKYW